MIDYNRLSPKEKLSAVMEALRFPLIMLVLYIHIVPLERHPVPLDLSIGNFTLFLKELFSHRFNFICNSVFFIMSGYFFFAKVPEQVGKEFFLGQWKRRIATLLIPYLLWNTLKALFALAKGYGMLALGMESGQGDIDWILNSSFYDIFISPIDEPLWYLRDLISMALLSPLVYLTLKYTKYIGLMLIIFIYILFPLAALGDRYIVFLSVVFFSIGSYFSISRINILEFMRPYKYYPLSLGLLLMLIATLTYPWEYSRNIEALGLVLSSMGVFYTMEMILTNLPRLGTQFIKYASSVFFIYACHELYFKNWTKGLFSRLPYSDTEIGSLISYILMPWVLLGTCLIIEAVVKKISPKAYGILTGGRIN